MKRLPAIICATLMLAIGFGGVALAVQDGAIARSYKATTTIPTGSLVSLSTQTDSVELATQANASRLIGVTAEDEQALVQVDPDTDQVSVIGGGMATVLVSTANGAIRAGDAIGVSPYSGIGMKAIESGYIVGIATSDFDSTSDSAQVQSVSKTSGERSEVSVGVVTARVAPGFRSQADADDQNRNGLQNFVKDLTGRDVSMVRIIISLVLATVTIVIVTVLTYAAVYGSIISIGRNPLAKNPILKALVFALLLGSFASLIAVSTIYLLLR